MDCVVAVAVAVTSMHLLGCVTMVTTNYKYGTTRVQTAVLEKKDNNVIITLMTRKIENEKKQGRNYKR